MVIEMKSVIYTRTICALDSDRIQRIFCILGGFGEGRSRLTQVLTQTGKARHPMEWME